MQFDFLALKPDVFGIDLSDLSLKVAKLARKGSGLRLATFGESPIPAGFIEQGEIKKPKELEHIIRSTIENVQGSALRTRNVIASLPEEKAFLQVIQLPKMNPAEVMNAALFEAENYIPYSLETVYIDSQVVRPLRNHLDHSDVLLASLPKNTIDSYVSLFRNAGLTIQALEIESLAQVRSLVPGEVSPIPLLVVDLGATRTSFIVFAGTSLRFTASIPVSSQQLTSAIATSFGTDLVKAEELKRKHGIISSPEGKKVYEAMMPLLNELVQQIKRYMDYYDSHAGHQHISQEERQIKKVILAGGGANLKGLDEFLAKSLKTEVFLGNPWVNIMPTPFHELPPLPLDQSLRYSTVLGLALRGTHP